MCWHLGSEQLQFSTVNGELRRLAELCLPLYQYRLSTPVIQIGENIRREGWTLGSSSDKGPDSRSPCIYLGLGPDMSWYVFLASQMPTSSWPNIKCICKFLIIVPRVPSWGSPKVSKVQWYLVIRNCPGLAWSLLYQELYTYIESSHYAIQDIRLKPA